MFAVTDLNPTRVSPARLMPRDLSMTAAIGMVGRPTKAAESWL